MAGGITAVCDAFVPNDYPISLSILLRAVGAGLVIFFGLVLYDIWFKRNKLHINEKQISLQRRNYSYVIEFDDIKKLLLYKQDDMCWLFIQKCDNIVRTIGLCPWKYDLQDIKGTLINITKLHNIEFSFTEDIHKVEELLNGSNRIPVPNDTFYSTADYSEETYIHKNSSEFYLNMFAPIIGLFILIPAFIWAIKRWDNIIILIMMFIPVCLCILSVISNYNRKEGDIILRRDSFTVNGKVFDWKDFKRIYIVNGNKKIKLIVETTHEEHNIEFFRLEELSEQFTYFRNKFTILEGLRNTQLLLK